MFRVSDSAGFPDRATSWLADPGAVASLRLTLEMVLSNLGFLSFELAMPEDFTTLNDPLSHRVALGLSKLGTALRHQAWRGASPLGLTPTQGQILTHVAEHAGSTLSQVSEALAVRPATASEAVATLVKKGLVRKARKATDGRALSLVLTAAGRDAAAQAAEWPDFLARAVEELKEEEQRVFLRALLGMIRALQQRGEIPVARMCLTCSFFRPHVHTSAERPHHCNFVDAPFGDGDLRIDCADHQPDLVSST